MSLRVRDRRLREMWHFSFTFTTSVQIAKKGKRPSPWWSRVIRLEAREAIGINSELGQ